MENDLKKIVILYHSSTGNTEMMADAIYEGVSCDGVKIKMSSFEKAKLEDVIGADGLAMGCYATAAEEIDYRYVYLFLKKLENDMKDKPLVLFGSYGWGNGKYMLNWEKMMKQMGANLLSEGYVTQYKPDENAIEECKSLGKLLRNAVDL